MEQRVQNITRKSTTMEVSTKDAPYEWRSHRHPRGADSSDILFRVGMKKDEQRRGLFALPMRLTSKR
jgi:hypothetical protein